MKHVAHERTWLGVTEGRECGTCYACCQWLGIDELKKYSGQACKHLDGSVDPAKRCTIYAKRPPACSGYECMWRSGYGPEKLKPSESGILMTGYNREDGRGFAITAIVFDYAKAKPIVDELIREVLGLDIQLRLVNFAAKTALFCTDGKIYKCKLLPPDGYESLTFAAEAPPIGTYYSANTKEG
jgi:Fe-S-cluster containining protein